MDVVYNVDPVQKVIVAKYDFQPRTGCEIGEKKLKKEKKRSKEPNYARMGKRG